MIVVPLAFGVAAVLLAIAAVHVYWAAGGQWGVSAAVPSRPEARSGHAVLFRPGAGATLAVALSLGAAALLVLGRAGVTPKMAPPWTYVYGAWGLGGVLLLRTIGEFRYVGLFKRVRGTRFATLDTWLYTPLCAMLAAAVWYLAAG